MTICAIHQPNFLPNESFFEKMKKSDIFIILDTAQFTYREFHARNYIPIGSKRFPIRVPVFNTGKKLKINEVKIDLKRKHKNYFWKNYFLKVLKYNYEKSPNFKFLYPKLQEIFNKECIKLIDLNMDIIFLFRSLLNIKTPILFSSEIERNNNIKSTRTQKIIDIVKSVNSDSYLSGHGAKNYMEEYKFNNNNINLQYLNTSNIDDQASLQYSILDKLFTTENENYKT